jgi:hypothetical protein
MMTQNTFFLFFLFRWKIHFHLSGKKKEQRTMNEMLQIIQKTVAIFKMLAVQGKCKS